MKKILCIIGPTATGKTDLALQLAKKFNGELVACDSRQVYKGLDLGTGKDAGTKLETSKHKGYWIIDGIKVWMYDVVSPKEQYSVSQYITDAKKIIEQIVKEGKLPILVGGTGLYLDGLLNGIETAEINANPQLRSELEALTLEELQKKFAELSSQEFEQLNNSERNNEQKLFFPSNLLWENLNESERNNKRRLIRKIEIKLADRLQGTGNSKKAGLAHEFDVLEIGLTAPREVLNQRIEKRALKRVDDGMVDEAKRLHAKGVSYERMRQLGLEYGVLADLLEGKIENQPKFVEILQQKIKQFAKRQLTWFKRPHYAKASRGEDKNIVWIDITEKNYSQEVAKLVENWYN